MIDMDEINAMNMEQQVAVFMSMAPKAIAKYFISVVGIVAGLDVEVQNRVSAKYAEIMGVLKDIESYDERDKALRLAVAANDLTYEAMNECEKGESSENEQAEQSGTTQA